MPKGKEIVGLDCDADAAQGIKQILSARLEELCALKPAALNWSDIEGVHDMRVASRRLRSALRDFKPNLKRRKQRRAGDAIKGIADALGAVRDKDVAIAALEKLEASASPDVAVGIELFACERRLMREIDRATLVEALANDLAGIRTDFETSIESALGSSNNSHHAHISFRTVGQNIIKSRVEELNRYSSSLYQPLASEQLHRMRIAAKRLRYAIELFEPCWGSGINAFAKEAAALQTSLGELHDCDLWIAEFGDLLKNLDEKPDGDLSDNAIQRRHAAVWLLSRFTKRRTTQYRNALARWYRWEKSDFLGRLVTSLQCSLPHRTEPEDDVSTGNNIAEDVRVESVS